MKIKIINKSNHPLPKYQTEYSAGLDLYANNKKAITIQPFGRELIKTGLFIELQKGYEAQIRPRSGLCLKKGLTVLNSPGTIDADYRGEIGVILVNISNKETLINPGDRIAQMIFAKHEIICWEEVDCLDETKRGKGGFGSTGTKKKIDL